MVDDLLKEIEKQRGCRRLGFYFTKEDERLSDTLVEKVRKALGNLVQHDEFFQVLKTPYEQLESTPAFEMKSRILYFAEKKGCYDGHVLEYEP